VDSQTRLLFKLERDPVLAAAVRAVSDPEEYLRLLSRSPLSPEVGEGGRGGGMSQGKEGSKTGGEVEGFDSKGFCLAGQTCDKNEFVYLQVL
jgi:hypothetical protein